MIRRFLSDSLENPITRILLILILGIIMVATGAFIQNLFPVWPIYITNAIYILPTGLFSAAIIGWILKAKSVNEMIAELFVDTKFLEANYINNKSMSTLINKALTSRYHIRKDNIHVINLLKYINEKILVNLDHPFASNAKLTRNLEIDGTSIKWTTFRHYEVESFKDNEILYGFPFELYIKKIPGQKRGIWLEGDYIRINGIDIINASEVDNHITLYKDGEIDYEKFIYKYNVTIKPGQILKLDARMSFNELNDGEIVDHIIFKFPVRKLTYSLHVDGKDKYVFNLYAPNSEDRTDDVVGNTINTNFDDWLIPGNTITTIIKKKDD